MPTAQRSASHSTLFLAGNAATGHWLRVHPDATPAYIAAQLRSLAAESGLQPQ